MCCVTCLCVLILLHWLVFFALNHQMLVPLANSCSLVLLQHHIQYLLQHVVETEPMQPV